MGVPVVWVCVGVCVLGDASGAWGVCGEGLRVVWGFLTPCVSLEGGGGRVFVIAGSSDSLVSYVRSIVLQEGE